MTFRAARVAGVTCALIAASVVTTVPAQAQTTNATESGDGPNICTLAGAVDPEPGIGYIPSAGKFTFTGTMDCTSDTHRQAEVTGIGAGPLGCSGGLSQAILKIAWVGGESSTVAMTIGDFLYGTGGFGRVSEGAFAGDMAGLALGREAAGAEARCFANDTTRYEIAGGFAIGGPA